METADRRSHRGDPPVFLRSWWSERADSRARPRSRTLCRDWSAAGERGRKLVSRVDLQLAEDAREMTLDRACGNEKSLGDLAVCEALAGELGDTALAGRQRVEPCEHYPARARAGGAQLGLGVFGERSGARAMSGVECLAEQLSSFAAAVASPQHRAEVGEGARSLQRDLAALELVDRLTQEQRSAVTAGNDAGSTLRYPERARRAECPG